MIREWVLVGGPSAGHVAESIGGQPAILLNVTATPGQLDLLQREEPRPELYWNERVGWYEQR